MVTANRLEKTDETGRTFVFERGGVDVRELGTCKFIGHIKSNEKEISAHTRNEHLLMPGEGSERSFHTWRRTIHDHDGKTFIRTFILATPEHVALWKVYPQWLDIDQAAEEAGYALERHSIEGDPKAKELQVFRKKGQAA